MNIAVVMRRRRLDNPWQSELWEVAAVRAPYQEGDSAAGPLAGQGDAAQWLHPGLRLELYRDECEGYFMNLTTAEPRIFVMWRMQDGRAVPQFVTASSHEASGWMDSGEEVGSVPMQAEVAHWVAEFVRDNYRPEPRKKRIKPQSFRDPADRAKS